jgi:lysophospholipid acyltransferase (LPLAT)-like uncharacterized protein
VNAWLRQKVLPSLVYYLYRAYASTWRLTLDEPESLKELIRSGNPFIFALWHGDEIALMRFSTHYHAATMASTSKDGELMNGVLHRFGFKTSRGSSTRGGARALLGLVRLVQQEKRAAVVTVDGPKGPYHVPKLGVFELSRILAAPIVVGGVACSNSHVFEKSWNKAYVPLPFSKVVLKWLDPMPAVPSDADTRQIGFGDALRERLELASRLASEKLDL